MSEKIPDSAYRRFFGLSPKQTPIKSYKPDSPYLIGTAALAAGAVAAAYIFRGDTDGGSGGGGENPDPDPDPGDDCPPNSHLQDGICICDSGYGNYGDMPNCHATVANCSVQEADQCKTCNGGYILENNVCYAQIDHCIAQSGKTCSQCETGFGIHGGDGTKCYPDIEHCKTSIWIFVRNVRQATVPIQMTAGAIKRLKTA